MYLTWAASPFLYRLNGPKLTLSENNTLTCIGEKLPVNAHQLDMLHIDIYNRLCLIVKFPKKGEIMTDRVGQRLDSYQLIRLLGTGSFGEVYLAEHVYRKDQVAVKVLPRLADSDLQSFLNEARSVRLKHPHIIQVRDFGIDNHVPFIVMDYAPHGTLRQRHPKGTRLPLASIVTYIEQIASALQYAHDERLIHRDIKPENLLVGAQGEVLVSDFGIATIARSSRSRSLVEMAGTVAYMAPEQVQGKPDVASDQYALAIIVYEWLCGDRPFNGTPVEVAVQQMVTAPASLCEKVSDLSPEVEQVVMKALAKDPKERFGNVQTFAAVLEQTYERHRLDSVSPSIVAHPVISAGSVAPTSQILDQVTHALSPSTSSVKSVSPTPEVISHSHPAVSSLPEKVRTPTIVEQSLSSSLVKSNESLPKVGGKQKPLIHLNHSEDPLPIFPSLGGASKRNHLLYSTLALSIVFVITLFTGGAYYFWHLQTDASQKLDQATALISQANPEKDAVDALQKLVVAQNDLRSLQSPFLVGSQSDRFVALQNNLQNKGKQAITNYNQNASINSLCNTITNTSTLNLTGTGWQSPVLTSVLQGQTVTSYLLAGNSSLHLLDGQKNPEMNESLGEIPFLLASNGQHLFVVTKQLGQGSYALHMYKPGQDGTLMDESNSPRAIDAKFMRNGEHPKLITVWNSDVYIFLAANNASTLDILSYNTDHFTDDPQRVQISVSLPLVSAAAFSNQQLFLLTQDGHIKSLVLSGGNGSNQSSAVEIPLPRAIATPVGVDPQDFQWNTPLVVPSSPSSGEIQQPFANITGATLLASGSIKEAMYLFVVDNLNHRIIQFQYIPNNAASTSGANGVVVTDLFPVLPTQAVGGAAVASPLQYTKQYASVSKLSSMKSLMVDPNQAAISLLTQTSGNSLSQVSINLTRTCASSS